jgi:hypothetical protein
VARIEKHSVQFVVPAGAPRAMTVSVCATWGVDESGEEFSETVLSLPSGVKLSKKEWLAVVEAANKAWAAMDAALPGIP